MGVSQPLPVFPLELPNFFLLALSLKGTGNELFDWLIIPLPLPILFTLFPLNQRWQKRDQKKKTLLILLTLIPLCFWLRFRFCFFDLHRIATLLVLPTPLPISSLVWTSPKWQSRVRSRGKIPTNIASTFSKFVTKLAGISLGSISAALSFVVYPPQEEMGGHVSSKAYLWCKFIIKILVALVVARNVIWWQSLAGPHDPKGL